MDMFETNLNWIWFGKRNKTDFIKENHPSLFCCLLFDKKKKGF